MCILHTQLTTNADHTTGHETVHVPMIAAFHIGTRYSLMMVYFYRNTRRFVLTVYMQLMWCMWLV
jgi:hypothetical protein